MSKLIIDGFKNISGLKMYEDRMWGLSNQFETEDDWIWKIESIFESEDSYSVNIMGKGFKGVTILVFRDESIEMVGAYPAIWIAESLKYKVTNLLKEDIEKKRFLSMIDNWLLEIYN